jgi:hemoglobin
MTPAPAKTGSRRGKRTMTEAELTAEQHRARRAEITDRIRQTTGIDEAMIERLVRAFYLKVQADPLLGPIFAAHIADWEPHLKKMFAFWSSVALHSGAYQGRPMPAHVFLPIDARHFDRWLALFAETADEICPPPAARHFVERAANIAQSLELGTASVAGVRVPPGERYRNPSLSN